MASCRVSDATAPLDAAYAGIPTCARRERACVVREECYAPPNVRTTPTPAPRQLVSDARAETHLALPALHRADVDDAAGFVLEHAWQAVLGHEEVALDVDVHHGVPNVRVQKVGRLAVVQLHAHVVDQNADVAPARTNAARTPQLLEQQRRRWWRPAAPAGSSDGSGGSRTLIPQETQQTHPAPAHFIASCAT